MNNDGEMTMMRDDYDAKRPTTRAKWLWCEVAMMRDVRKPDCDQAIIKVYVSVIHAGDMGALSLGLMWEMGLLTE